MSNSPLVSYTKLSPNYSVRNHAIDSVAIHCVVGQVTVESLGAVFASKERNASSNYGIGRDGRIAMFVEEKNRSFCTGGKDKNGNPIRVNGISGKDVDHRAITIEVASDTTDPYAVNDKAYASLINLLVDICKRNNIKELKWEANKTLVGNINRQNMFVHRWFAYKACPGDYLFNRHGDIAAKVNARLQNGSSAVETKPASTTTSKEFAVKVSISNLNVRKGPGTNYAKIGKYTGVGVFTIVAISNGKGSKKGWGKLKSGLGWISLDFATRI